MTKTRYSVLLLSLFVLSSFDTACGQTSVSSVQNLTPPPPVRREFRAAWIASVENIDWPSAPGLSTRQQQQELIEMLDRAVQLRLNAVILQVRPAADALYASPYEPWSEYLTGRMGRAPNPYYDPLEFAVSEAHRRGLELHAWFNPYRARHPSARSAPSRDHISVTHPEFVKRYGSNLWMDPGEPAVREQTIRVVLDVVKRYDIDGVHIDDYFYPYKEKDRRGNNIDFPDARSWRRYKASGGSLAKDDWRRANVDSLIRQVYVGIKASKPWVKFGISPFGVWRPGYPSITAGKFDSYAELYGDSRKWVLNGWADYFTPQLYWPIDRPDLSYPVLLQWWVEQNAKGRHVWPGNYVDKVTGTPSGWLAEEMLNQIALTRAQPGATGNVYFSMRTLMGNGDNLPQKLMSGPYANKTLVPASPWLDSIPPVSPIVRVGTDAVTLVNTISLQPQGTEPTWLWLVRTRVGNDWTTDVVPGLQRFYPLPRPAGGGYADAVSVSAVDRSGNESAPVIIALTPAVPR
ncbi:MAG TPA: family 10 glycosylhydrolase [Gemmatimonadaceae bacterium]|nr:family 10 glycosylhydrolase [Gemmatimonadaceae bacterium]